MSFETMKKVARYIVSGGSGAVVDLFCLYAFVEWFGIWYVLAAILAFIIAFFVSFSLQKFWTFKDMELNGIHVQATRYFIVSAANLAMNTLLMYLFVEIAGMHYLISQLITGAVLAVSSFFIYSKFVFIRTPPENLSLAENANNL